MDIASDGIEGLRKGLEEDFSLILLDLMLPGIDGFEICRKLKGTYRYTDTYGHGETGRYR